MASCWFIFFDRELQAAMSGSHATAILGRVARFRTGVWNRAERSPEERRQQYSALTISAILHVVLLGLLAIWVIRVPPPPSPVSTVVDFRQPTEETITELTTTVSAAAASQSSSRSPSENIVPVSISESSPSPPEIRVTEEVMVASVRSGLDVPVTEKIPLDLRKHRPPGELVKETRVEAETELEGVAGQVLNSLKGATELGPTVAVWMLDQSMSMQEQHFLFADRLKEELVAMHKAFEDDPIRLMHVGVAYGISSYEFLSPTNKPFALMTAMKEKVSVDPSGAENVFTAVQRSILEYKVRKRPYRNRNLVIIILTDESGDDLQLLEPTILLCEKHNVRVDVVGPSAVLGRQKGFQLFVHPLNGISYYLPVDRGPDCGFPQRTGLAYWHRDVPLDWDEEERGPWPGMYPAWMGGSNHEALLSGFSPYALTRLTRETGGQYTIFDRPADRSPFELNRMRAYMPDYRSLKEIDADMRQEDAALRRAVVTAVQLGGPGPPPMQFGVGRLLPVTHFNWINPAAFQSSGELAAAIKQSENASRQLERVLRVFGEDGMDTEYQRELSPRWRAWYDLTRGRLLAASVRHLEFQLFARQLSGRGGVDPRTNGLLFGPGEERCPLPLCQSRSAEAKRLLQRCIEENYETPWRYLAERELNVPFGVAVIQLSIPQPPIPPPAPALPPGPAISLPKL